MASMSPVSPAQVACCCSWSPSGLLASMPCLLPMLPNDSLTPAGKHNITCEIEKIPMDYVNTALERLIKNDVHYR